MPANVKVSLSECRRQARLPFHHVTCRSATRSSNYSTKGFVKILILFSFHRHPFLIQEFATMAQPQGQMIHRDPALLYVYSPALFGGLLLIWFIATGFSSRSRWSWYGSAFGVALRMRQVSDGCDNLSVIGSDGYLATLRYYPSPVYSQETRSQSHSRAVHCPPMPSLDATNPQHLT